MNVIVTLRPNHIQLIKEGKKRIILRKNCPARFNHQKDVIYICEKGSKNVVGYTTIEQIICTHNKFGILTGWSKGIAISLEMIASYIKDAVELYGFFIGGYKFFDKPLTLDDHFHVYKGPGTFVYTSDNYR